jgi:hypothetical protein
LPPAATRRNVGRVVRLLAATLKIAYVPCEEPSAARGAAGEAAILSEGSTPVLAAPPPLACLAPDSVEAIFEWRERNGSAPALAPVRETPKNGACGRQRATGRHEGSGK